MRECWYFDPNKRPAFIDIAHRIRKSISVPPPSLKHDIEDDDHEYVNLSPGTSTA